MTRILLPTNADLEDQLSNNVDVQIDDFSSIDLFVQYKLYYKNKEFRIKHL